jgi:predicted small secreted protein
MQRRTIAPLVVACLLVLAGCSSPSGVGWRVSILAASTFLKTNISLSRPTHRRQIAVSGASREMRHPRRRRPQHPHLRTVSVTTMMTVPASTTRRRATTVRPAINMIVATSTTQRSPNSGSRATIQRKTHRDSTVTATAKPVNSDSSRLLAAHSLLRKQIDSNGDHISDGASSGERCHECGGDESSK